MATRANLIFELSDEHECCVTPCVIFAQREIVPIAHTTTDSESPLETIRKDERDGPDGIEGVPGRVRRRGDGYDRVCAGDDRNRQGGRLAQHGRQRQQQPRQLRAWKFGTEEQKQKYLAPIVSSLVRRSARIRSSASR